MSEPTEAGRPDRSWTLKDYELLPLWWDPTWAAWSPPPEWGEPD